MVRGHGGDDPVHGPALERVHGGRPGPVEVAELRIAVGESRRRSVLQAEAHAVTVDALHGRGRTVDQAEAGFVARPAHPVTGAAVPSRRPGTPRPRPSRQRDAPGPT